MSFFSSREIGYQPFLDGFIPQLNINHLQKKPVADELATEVANAIVLETNITFPVDVVSLANLCCIPRIIEEKGPTYWNGCIVPLVGCEDLYDLIKVRPPLCEWEKRATIAHEIGHKILKLLGLTDCQYYMGESFCNTFAATILAPDHLIHGQIKENGLTPPELFEKLLEEAKFPPYMAAKRLIDAGLYPHTIATIFVGRYFKDMYGRTNNQMIDADYLYFRGRSDLGDNRNSGNKNDSFVGLTNYCHYNRELWNNPEEIIELEELYGYESSGPDLPISIFRIDAQSLVLTSDGVPCYQVIFMEKGQKIAEVTDLYYFNEGKGEVLNGEDLGWE